MAAIFLDRNLFYGVLALRMGVVTDTALIDALHAWSGDRVESLGHILLEQRDISPEDHARIEGELDRLETISRDPGKDSSALEFLTGDTVMPGGDTGANSIRAEEDGGPTFPDLPVGNGPDATSPASTVVDAKVGMGQKH